jgi:hypothetical protein
MDIEEAQRFWIEDFLPALVEWLRPILPAGIGMATSRASSATRGGTSWCRSPRAPRSPSRTLD